MIKKKKYILLICLLLLPELVFASSGNDELPLQWALFLEGILSISMFFFIILPILMNVKDSKKLVKILLISRAVILLLFDLFITTYIAYVDLFFLVIGSFIMPFITERYLKNIKQKNIELKKQVDEVEGNVLMKSIFCSQCGAKISDTDSFCGNCGKKIERTEPISENKFENVIAPKTNVVNANNFNPIFSNSEDKLLEEFIKKEMAKAGIVDDNKMFPTYALKRKNILSIIFSILVFVYVTLIFFHFPFLTYLLGLAVLVIFFSVTSNYDLMKYLKKEVKSRPSEKISNIVMNVKTTFVKDKLKPLRISAIVICAIIPMIIFIKPMIIYEKVEGGYAVRYYIFGLTNFTSANIPETYKGEKVVSLRGNTFSNMPFLKEVTLPNTITEIRGQAFKNDINLVSVNIPEKLEYLGGGAFYNCKSITSIYLPDTLTYLGGESFSNAKSLVNVKLSENITEIRGNTFENCKSLLSIDIPDNVTRIGAHAFYGNTILRKVTISTNSKLREIGSSAFRDCYSLYNIDVPSSTSINERAFKGSPTTINYFNTYPNYYNSNY